MGAQSPRLPRDRVGLGRREALHVLAGTLVILPVPFGDARRQDQDRHAQSLQQLAPSRRPGYLGAFAPAPP